MAQADLDQAQAGALQWTGAPPASKASFLDCTLSSKNLTPQLLSVMQALFFFYPLSVCVSLGCTPWADWDHAYLDTISSCL